MSEENDFSIGLHTTAPSKYTAVSIWATDEEQLPLLLVEAVEGIPKALNGCAGARRRGQEVTEVSILVGEWAKDKARRLTFEELVTELRKHVE